VVWNHALALCREAGKAISGFELLRRLTQAKRTEEQIWLNEVSAKALEQSVRRLSQAFQNFFNSCKGKRKGGKVKPPRFKKKSNQQAATFTKVSFSLKPNGGVQLPKDLGIAYPIWTRPLPSEPTLVFEPFSHMPL